jgi:large subunit ribosomal protein L5
VNEMSEMISVEKITLNIGVGTAGETLEKAKKLLVKFTEQKPVETKSIKRIPAWDLKKGTSIGAKVTLRGKKAEETLNRCLDAVERKIKKRSFAEGGNVSFGVREYIDIPGFKYDPDIGMFGFDVCITLKKWGYRIGKRKLKKAGMPARHILKKDEAIDFMVKKFNVEVI